jgi:7-cyano-7-deazaguanine synthase
LLFSGGIESAHLLFRLLEAKQHVFPLYVAAGHAWEEAEIQAASKLCSQSGVERLEVLRTDLRSLYGRHWTQTDQVPDANSADEEVALPARNAFLLGSAAVYCQSHRLNRVVLGTLGSNPFPDASARFFRASQDWLSLAVGFPVRIEAPLFGHSKSEVIRQSRDIPIEHTFSCINPYGIRHCGDCNKCEERRRAFRTAGCDDPTQYAILSKERRARIAT